MPQNHHQPLLQRVRNNLYLLELIELFVVGFAFATLFNVVTWREGDMFITLLIQFLVPLGLWALWAVYMLYILIARAGGKMVDILLWVVLAVLTSSFTFWYWTILDLNRRFVTWLLYTGHAPVEYAWSFKSKARRKAWNKATKEAQQAYLGYA